MWDPGWHMGWMGLWWIFLLVIIVAVVWAFARAGLPGQAGGGESPELILKRRYARGEIDREEYDRRLQDLRR
jgi:putative membrane protein